MSYIDFIFSSIDSGLPAEMLGCTILNEANILAALDSDSMGARAWD